MSDTSTKMPSGDPDTSVTIFVGLIGAIVLFAIIVGLQALFYHAGDEQSVAKVLQRDSRELRQLEDSHKQQLGRYRWIDEQNEVTGVPIGRAMDLVVEEARSSDAEQ